jgi:hypothetical protein
MTHDVEGASRDGRARRSRRTGAGSSRWHTHGRQVGEREGAAREQNRDVACITQSSTAT